MRMHANAVSFGANGSATGYRTVLGRCVARGGRINDPGGGWRDAWAPMRNGALRLPFSSPAPDRFTTAARLPDCPITDGWRSCPACGRRNALFF